MIARGLLSNGIFLLSLSGFIEVQKSSREKTSAKVF